MKARPGWGGSEWCQVYNMVLGLRRTNQRTQLTILLQSLRFLRNLTTNSQDVPRGEI